MKLKVARGKLAQPVSGVQATIIRNDVVGSVLVVEGGEYVLNLKISDLIAFLEEQDKAEAEVAQSE